MALSVVAAALVRRPGRGPIWPLAAFPGLLGLIGIQFTLGSGRVLALHVRMGGDDHRPDRGHRVAGLAH